jgi:hypothetical protein
MEGTMGNQTRLTAVLGTAGRAALAITLALGAGGSLQAEDGKWSFSLEPMYMDAYGHDQHVLTIHKVDLDATPQLDDKTAVTLDTDADLAYRSEVRYTKGQWGLGAEFFLFLTSQSAADQTAAADGPSGPVDQAIFEVPDRRFTSSDPSQALFYRILEDTDLEVWTLDLYAMRTLAEKPESSFHLLFGLRFGDFDNDYHAAVGVQDVSGLLLDASSNYDRMMGPLVGLVGNIHRGRSSIEGYVGQSVIFGSAGLTRMSREFTGPFSSTPSFVSQEVFRKEQDVAIPITELRIKLAYEITRNLSLGAGVNTSVWWDVPVPPGVIPVEGGDQALHENTIVFLGLSGAAKITF